MSRGCVCLNVGLAITLILLCVGIILITFVPNLIKKTITHEAILQNGTKLFEAWLSPPGEVYAQFYLFSVLNPAEIKRGKTPVVQQIGPYAYREQIIKSDVVFSPDNESVSYRELRFYTFCPELSNGSESDKLTILNLAYVAMAEKASSVPNLVSFLINIIDKYYKEDLFIEKNVKETIWGYEDPVLKKLSKVVSVPTIVGLFVGKNGTNNGVDAINTGVSGLEKLGQFISYHDQSKLSYWGSDSANAINGSDGSLVPPFRRARDKIYVFAGDICRSIGLTFESSTSIKGIPALIFSPTEEILLSPDLNPDNQGFCLSYPHCLKSGVLNMSSCLPGAPVVISMPHFYMADKSYQNAIIGLLPTADMVTRLTIEKQTGIILQAQKMLQINGIVRRNPHFTALKHIFQDCVFLPVGYINESFLLPDYLADELREKLVTPAFYSRVTSVCLITLSSLSLFLLFTAFLFLQQKPTLLKRSSILDDDDDDDENEQTPLCDSAVYI